MAAQPSEEDILVFCELSGIPRAEALARLKGNNNDLNQAMNELYDNLGSTQYTWDESQFNSDRDGTINTSGVAFQVQGPDEHGPNNYLGHDGYLSGAPSRPPSRTSNVSAASNRVVSLAAEHAAADPRDRMSNAEINDMDLQKALAQSAEEYGLPLQDFGTISSENTVHFGPANRDATYEQGKWDLVHMPSASTHETQEIPNPFDRKRDEDAPAALRPGPGHRLSSLLTIYHEIPLMREIFLDRNNVLSNYGYDKMWWDGATITQAELSRTLIDSDGPETRNQNKALTYEIQRLMAFLDKTDRSYGSAEALSALNSIRKISAPDMESRFLEAWKRLHRKDGLFSALFSTALQPKGTDEDFDVEQVGDAETLEFHMLDLELPSHEDPDHIGTLYDLADQALWNTSGSTTSSSAYISHLGDVIAFRLRDAYHSKKVEIPIDWYADRYLQMNRDAALTMRLRKEQVKEQMRRIVHIEKKLTVYTLPDGREIKVQDLLESCLMHDVEPTTDGIPVESISQSPHDDPPLRNIYKTDVSSELRKIMANIDKKLQALNQEKQYAHASLRELSKLYTEPAAELNSVPQYRYSLRGVSATNDITYLRRYAEPDLIDMDLDELNPRESSDQWWRIAFTSSKSKPLEIIKVAQTQVLEAIANDSTSPILIYASERALAEPVRPLPDPLETFIKTDNLEFSKEFTTPQNPTDSPKSPRKRNYDDSSVDSQDITKRYSGPRLPRWSSDAPQDAVHVSQHEIQDDPNASVSTKSLDQHDGTSKTNRVIMGVSPNDLVDTTVPENEQPEDESFSQEMQGMTAGHSSFSVSSRENDISESGRGKDTLDLIASKQ